MWENSRAPELTRRAGEGGFGPRVSRAFQYVVDCGGAQLCDVYSFGHEASGRVSPQGTDRPESRMRAAREEGCMAGPFSSRIRKLDRSLMRVGELAMRRLAPTRIHAIGLRSPEGHSLPARLHTPQGSGPWPGVLLVPGGLDGARSLESPRCVLPAQRLARAGFSVGVFTPSGREGCSGSADCNGPLHQEECGAALQALVKHPLVRSGPVSILTLSFGLVMALGALRRRSDLSGSVGLLVDWEGPGSRRWFEAARIGWDPGDDAFWEPREGIRLVEGLSVPYHRFQSCWDHVHGPDTEIGWEMVQAAARAATATVSLNGHAPPPASREAVVWGPELRSRQGAVLLQWLIQAAQDGEKDPPG